MIKSALVVVALLTTASIRLATAANLVANPGFETGNFTGWTQGEDLSYTSVSSNYVDSGDFSAQLGPVAEGMLFQDLATTAGGIYQLTFYLTSGNGDTEILSPGQPNTVTQDPQFQAYFAGQLVYDTATAGDPGATFIQINVNNLAAMSGTSRLQFDFVNSESYYFLDDISVTLLSIPEPSTWTLAAGGLGALLLLQRRRRASQAGGIHAWLSPHRFFGIARK